MKQINTPLSDISPNVSSTNMNISNVGSNTGINVTSNPMDETTATVTCTTQTPRATIVVQQVIMKWNETKRIHLENIYSIKRSNMIPVKLKLILHLENAYLKPYQYFECGIRPKMNYFFDFLVFGLFFSLIFTEALWKHICQCNFVKFFLLLFLLLLNNLRCLHKRWARDVLKSHKLIKNAASTYLPFIHLLQFYYFDLFFIHFCTVSNARLTSFFGFYYSRTAWEYNYYSSFH